LLIAVYCYWIVADSAWVFGDDVILVNTVVSGHPLLLSFAEIGRFYPLGFCDLNLLLWVGNQPFYFLAHSAFKLIVISVLLGFALKKMNPNSWPMFLLGFLLLNTVILVHLNSYYPESMMMITFSGFALAYMKGLETRKKKYLLIAAIFSMIAIYEKETVFALFMTIAVSGMALHSSEDREFTKPLNIFLLVNSLLFLVLYYFFVYRYAIRLYEVGKHDSVFQAFIPMLRYDQTMLLFLFLGLARILFLIRGDRRNIVSDIFLSGGIAFVGSYLGLRMYKPYNMIPAYIFLIIAFAGYCRNFSFFTTVTATLLIILVLRASPKIIETKTLTHRLRLDQVEISEMLANYSRNRFKLFYLSTDKPKLARLQTYRMRVLNSIPKSQYPEIRTIELIDTVPSQEALVIAGRESRSPDPALVLVKTTQEYKLYSTR
jgi:hypothetical protein